MRMRQGGEDFRGKKMPAAKTAPAAGKKCFKQNSCDRGEGFKKRSQPKLTAGRQKQTMGIPTDTSPVKLRVNVEMILHAVPFVTLMRFTKAGRGLK